MLRIPFKVKAGEEGAEQTDKEPELTRRSRSRACYELGTCVRFRQAALTCACRGMLRRKNRVVLSRHQVGSSARKRRAGAAAAATVNCQESRRQVKELVLRHPLFKGIMH